MDYDFFQDALGSVFQQRPLMTGDPGASVSHPRRFTDASEHTTLTIGLANVKSRDTKLMAHFLWASSPLMADLIDLNLLDVRHKRFAFGVTYGSVTEAL
jgi:hypothetical protein